MAPDDCLNDTDPLKLVREGTNRAQRAARALDPLYAQIDEKQIAQGMIFARSYAAFLRYYDLDNTDTGKRWDLFFDSDVSVRLAIAAAEDVPRYATTVSHALDFLRDLGNESDEAGLRLRLGQVFSSVATLARQLDVLKESLPGDLPLKAALGNLITRHLAPAFRNLMLYYRDGLVPASVPPAGPYLDVTAAPVGIMGQSSSFKQVQEDGLSGDWILHAGNWDDYVADLQDTAAHPATQIYGTGSTLFSRVDHIAAHHLFKSSLDQFLKAYSRVVSEAASALRLSMNGRDTHEPHYALFLAFLRLFGHARDEINTLTGRHLDFYYRDIVQLMEKPAAAPHAHVLVELTRQSPSALLPAGTRLRAGKDARGAEVFFVAPRDAVLNRASVAALKAIYRHGDEATGLVNPTTINRGRIYASPIANSADGLGAPLVSADVAWHPFHNKVYRDGMLDDIAMPKAQIGFAIASHYLLLAEGDREISLSFTLEGAPPALQADWKDLLACRLTMSDGWLDKPVVKFALEAGKLAVKVVLDGADPAITPYSEALHGLHLTTDLPVLEIVLRQDKGRPFIYTPLQDVTLRDVTLNVRASGLKTLAASNDFGPIDLSKPFQPFGPAPVKNSAFVVGSREAFQKTLDTLTLKLSWLNPPKPYGVAPNVHIDFLQGGQWLATPDSPTPVGNMIFSVEHGVDTSVVDQPDLAPDEIFSTRSRHGYVRLRLDNHFGQLEYQQDLIAYVTQQSAPAASSVMIELPATSGGTDSERAGIGSSHPGAPPAGPFATSLQLSYSAVQTTRLDSTDAAQFDQRTTRFFHCAPFGSAEQHPRLVAENKVRLFPQFSFSRAAPDSDTQDAGELYIGIQDLVPPQNLALLIQVSPGTADPLSVKPDPHVRWSYLSHDEWVAFAPHEVDDPTRGLLRTGIVTLSMPRDANDGNTVLPADMHWVRVSVQTRTDAVCKLLMVAAQAVEVVFQDHDNDPAFTAGILPAGTITKLQTPDAAVKKIVQPFAGFDGCGAETAGDFHTRASERLRHKDRDITLWDAEHLVLDAFPQVYKVRCLNHTQYEPSENGAGIYRELAPGHVTIVPIPLIEPGSRQNPLRPYASLDLLEQIAGYLSKRASCFTRIHVRNPLFEEVRTVFKAKLRPGYDESFHVKRLQQEIVRFLSPWAFTSEGGPSFGGRVQKSALIDHVEAMPFIDHVTDFQLFHDVGGTLGTTDLNEIQGSRAVSILVSAPAGKHRIDVIQPTSQEGTGEQCPCEAS